MNETEVYRQGDVLLQRVDFDPRQKKHQKVPRDGGRIILAYGEVTGHAHAIMDVEAEMVQVGNERFVVTEKGISITHEEHEQIVIGPGYWRVVRQQEFDPGVQRYVAD